LYKQQTSTTKIRRSFLAPNTQNIEAQYDIVMHVAHHGMVSQHSTWFTKVKFLYGWH